MKKLILSSFLFAAIISGCASVPIVPGPSQASQISNPTSVTVIVPNDQNVDGKAFKNLDFAKLTWDVEYYQGRISKEQVVQFNNKSDSSFEVDRRIDNGGVGSGIVYTVGYNLKNDTNNTVFTFTPLKYKTYQQGLIFVFPVPKCSVDEVIEYLTKNQNVGYKLEFNSQYSPESLFANFKRVANVESYGTKDPVTGDISNYSFSIFYKYNKIRFVLNVFPYKNGSKAVIYLKVPGIYTSTNTIDYNVILLDIKTQLEAIVNS